jgi:hypothetical protein
MNQTQKLLSYWYNLEFFSPFWPETRKDTTTYINAHNPNLPWMKKMSFQFNYDVYLGKVMSQDLIVKMLEATGKTDDAIEKDNSKSCICAFKVKPDGTYVGDSFSVSTFVWAIAKIIAEKNMRADFDIAKIDTLNAEMNDVLTTINKKLQYDDLEKIHTIVIGKILLPENANAFSAVINQKKAKAEKPTGDEVDKNEGSQENDTNASTDMLSSFYASDIDMIRCKVQDGDSIVRYIEALNRPSVNRVEIDTDITNMKKWLSPERLPLGKWPSAYSPSLMQQLAINIAISKNEDSSSFFSVNGPPGTGKTTLLKEIIASYIVDRALLLSEYKKPDDAFKECTFIAPPNEFLKKFYQMDAKLTQYGILIASNNNAAVENISRELPIAKDVKESNTSLFNIDESSEIYFSTIANTLMENNEKCWGLISARLGRKTNIDGLKQALWFNEGMNLRLLLKEKPPEWQQAKATFKNKYAEVLEYRNQIEEAVKNTNKHNEIVMELTNAQELVSSAKQGIVEQENGLKQKYKEQQNVKQQLEVLEQNKILLSNRISVFKRLFSFLFKNDPLIIQFNHTKQELNTTTITLTNINLECSKCEKHLDEAKDNYTEKQKYCKEKQQEFVASSQQLEKYKEQFGPNFGGDDFWTTIEKNERSQLASPWTDRRYDTHREELFYDALMLQKAFILNSKCVKQNLNCLVNMWNNNFLEQDKALAYSHLLNSMFLVVPVVSTTFASVATFLKHIGKKELGTLIIDEAGQATPHSALGALWRTSKAIIVGDPLQVEPVVTIPKELCKRFAEEFQIENAYKSQELSVQVLADSMNPYGGYREYLDCKIWLGCPLVIHRRCLDPMFSISNQVTYNNRMFKQSMEPKKDVLLLLKESIWMDIKGKENGDKDHFVPEQGEQVIEMVLNAFELQKGFPRLYIISPFKSVSNNIKTVLKKFLYKHYQEYNKDDGIDKWIEKSCGTVHTFQGKEANEVIFVLGCDTKSGAGAAQWAGKKPNILNVAVTRAKYRIAIIGDSHLWSKVPNFDFVHKTLYKR